VNRFAMTAIVLTALTLPDTEITAQQPDDAVMAEYSGIRASVIRIRTMADLEYNERDRRTGEIRQAERPYSVDGTGVVVGRMWVDGFLEYLILTNHHVADASNYVLEVGGYLRVNPTNTLAFPSVPEESYLMKAASDSVTSADIGLIELVRLVRGDMTLMRTVGANRDLTVFEGKIGYEEGEVRVGDPIVTSGYPFGGEKVIQMGSITEVDHLHELGLPHEDFVLDVPVHPGQSGGPVFLVEGDPEAGEELSFRLIGLVHAKDRDRSYAVPYRLWENSLDAFPAELQERLVR
jgi:hypothetical protein